MTKYANLVNKQRSAIVEQISNLGLLNLGDELPTKVIMCEDVCCPICGSSLEVYTSGNSYQIACPTDGRIAVFRGFANPSYFKV